MEDWDQDSWKETKDLIADFGHLFSLDDLHLGKTFAVNHSIILANQTPFKERYREIPPSQYGEVRKHLKEMLEVGVIRKSSSPWVSAVVFVRKKNRSSGFA